MTQTEFEARVISMRDTLYRVSASILPQQCDREDAISECVLKAFSRRQKLRDERALRAWVIRILTNECYMILRRRKREFPAEMLPENAFEHTPDAHVPVYRLLLALPEKYRLPMVLYYVEGYPVKEIAGMLRLPGGTVKSRLSRGREMFRAMYREEEGA